MCTLDLGSDTLEGRGENGVGGLFCIKSSFAKMIKGRDTEPGVKKTRIHYVGRGKGVYSLQV